MLSEPPGADPHAGWCGRGQGKPGLYPILRGGQPEPTKRRAVPTATPNMVWTPCWWCPELEVSASVRLS